MTRKTICAYEVKPGDMIFWSNTRDETMVLTVHTEESDVNNSAVTTITAIDGTTGQYDSHDYFSVTRTTASDMHFALLQTVANLVERVLFLEETILTLQTRNRVIG
jgi:hypothetical protein